MCPSTGQERFQFSRGASVSVLVETTRNDFAAVSSVTKRWLHSIWWPCLHFLNGRITTSYFAIYHNTKSLAVYLLRTRGSYWSLGPNRVPVNKWFWIWCINDGHGVSNYNHHDNHRKEGRSAQVDRQSQVSRHLVSELSGSPSWAPADGTYHNS